MLHEQTTAPTLAEPQARFAEQKIIEVSFWKAISIVGVAILVSIVGTAFTVGSVLNTDHFTLVTATSDIAELKEITVRKDLYELQQEAIIESLDQQSKDLDNITKLITTQVIN